MLKKIWKKILILILIIACLVNIIKKLVQRESLKAEIESTLNYFSKQNETTQNSMPQQNNTLSRSKIEETQNNETIQNNAEELLENN